MNWNFAAKVEVGVGLPSELIGSKVFTLSCEDEFWQLMLELHLREGFDVNLTNFHVERDGRFCELMACSHDRTFTLDGAPHKNAAQFRKRSSN